MTLVRGKARFSAKLPVLAGATAAAVACIGLSIPSAADATPEISVSPQSIFPADQYYATTHGLAGEGAVVTVTVGPNNVLIPGYPVEVQECNAHPIAGDDCDMLTTLTYDQLTKKPVSAEANGSVTVHFLVWSPLPNQWDPASVIKVGPGHPTALWIGDDPSEWATTGFVTAPVVVSTAPVKTSQGASVRAASNVKNGADLAAKTSHGTGLGTIIAIVLVAFVLGVGCTLAIRRRPKTRVRGS